MQTRLLILGRQVVMTVCLVLLTASPAISDVRAEYHKLNQAGYLLLDRNAVAQEQSRADELLIPASTVKLITAYLCLQYWGEDHRFTTAFYVDSANARLWVKAGGDPFLVSEEISLIASGLAKALKTIEVSRVDTIGLDVSLFTPDLVVPGATTTDNPYDAVPSALAANFNTLHIEKAGNRVVSAEPQTPLTPLAKMTGLQLTRDGAQRVNLGRESENSERYFAELLTSMLEKEGVHVSGNIVRGSAPDGAALYVHRNSRTLGEMLQGMLKYSTNFIANQLMLTLVANRVGQAANFRLVREFMEESLREEFGWTSFSLLEGAGLSRDNRLSARQLTDVVKRFAPWRHLLPEISSQVFAKTGTLSDVKTLAGFVNGSAGSHAPFAILINEPVPREMPLQLIRALSNK